MSDNVVKKFTQKLTDWLIATFIALLFVWFIVTQPVFKNDTALVGKLADSQNLKNHVQLLTVGYAPRTINYDNLNATADYIFRQFETIGKPGFQYLDRLSKQYRNVVLHLGPDTKEVYVVGAHYDAENDSIDSEGNASGVATLIELARQVAKQAHQLGTGITFVAYPISTNQTENVTSTGSFLHAKTLLKKNKQVNLMLSLDSVGRFNSESGSQRHPHSFMQMLYPNEGNYLNMIGRVQDIYKIRALKKSFQKHSQLPLYSQNLPEYFTKAQSSDHLSYWRYGFPAILISDTKHYRKLKDKNTNLIDSLDYDKMAMLVDGLTKALLHNTVSNINNERIVQRSRNNHLKQTTIH